MKLLSPFFVILVSLSSLLILVVAPAPSTAVATFPDPLLYSGRDFPRGLQIRETRLVSPTPSNSATITSDSDMISRMLQQVDRDRASSDLRQLTGETPLCMAGSCYSITNRLTGSEGLAWAMDSLYEKLVGLGYAVEFQDWSRSGYADRNLIAKKTGVLTPTEEIYLVAHVDGVRNSDERYPAADDNASSVVNGLELARVFSSHQFGRTIVLFFSTGEEQGTLGASQYLEELSPSDLSAIKYVINRDATGYDANGDGVMDLAHGGDPPSQALAQVMSDTMDIYGLDLDQRMIVGCP
jgi:hypothetical protein